MRPSMRFVLVYVCLTLCAGVSHASAQAVAQKVSSPPPLWQLEIPRNEPPKDFLGPRVVSDQARVFYLQAGQVKAVDAATGRQLWTYPIGKWTQLRYSSGRLLAITYNGKVVALNAQTGRVHWHKKNIDTNFAVAEDTLYFVDLKGVGALDLTTGKPLWRTAEAALSTTSTIYNDAPLTVAGDALFIQNVVFDAMSTNVRVYDAKTGKFLLKTYSFGPAATVNGNSFIVDDFPVQLDYPDRFNLNVYNSRTSRLSERVYSVKNRVKGNDWSSKVAVNDAVYISGGGNVACFPLAAPGGKAKPNFIRVPQGDVQWLAGPRNGTFVLEWQNILWLVRQNRKPCKPLALLKGTKLGKGALARISAAKDGLYIGLKNGTFYAVDTRNARVVLKLELRSYAFGPTHVVGDTLVIQAGNRLLAYPLPKALKP